MVSGESRMIDVLVELAESYPLIFLGLLGLGILLAVILFVAALKVTRLILKAVYFLFTVGLVVILTMITLVAAEHIYSAMTYEPPPANPSAPVPEQEHPSTSQYDTYNEPVP